MPAPGRQQTMVPRVANDGIRHKNGNQARSSCVGNAVQAGRDFQALRKPLSVCAQRGTEGAVESTTWLRPCQRDWKRCFLQVGTFGYLYRSRWNWTGDAPRRRRSTSQSARAEMATRCPSGTATATALRCCAPLHCIEAPPGHLSADEVQGAPSSARKYRLLPAPGRLP